MAGQAIYGQLTLDQLSVGIRLDAPRGRSKIATNTLRWPSQSNGQSYTVPVERVIFANRSNADVVLIVRHDDNKVWVPSPSHRLYPTTKATLVAQDKWFETFESTRQYSIQTATAGTLKFTDPDQDGYPNGDGQRDLYGRLIYGRSIDNCPNIANPDQKNTKGYSSGDACAVLDINLNGEFGPDDVSCLVGQFNGGRDPANPITRNCQDVLSNHTYFHGYDPSCDDRLTLNEIGAFISLSITGRYSPDYAQYDQNGNGLADCQESDSDGDSVISAFDNCPATANPDQADGDHNYIGNVCDTPAGFCRRSMVEGDNWAVETPAGQFISRCDGSDWLIEACTFPEGDYSVRHPITVNCASWGQGFTCMTYANQSTKCGQ